MKKYTDFILEEAVKDYPFAFILTDETPEGLEKATQKYNEIIIKEHEQARKEKDEQLKQKGLVVEEQKETKTESREER